MSKLTLDVEAADAAQDRVAEHVTLLTNILRGTDWMTATAIREGWMPHWPDRYVRQLAAASDGAILSGQRGYKLTLECTPEEVRHATNWLRSQAKRMISRSIAIARKFHAAATNR
ncbi:MAG: hypothetical protein EBR82_47415 [Caulobacteraceae bacterium]|nr:hypothetical protein [Caulobacteraceae bacterium]